MARINPIYTGLLFIRRIGLAVGAWIFVDYAFCWMAPPASSLAAGIAWGAAIFAFFAPMIHLGPSNRDEN